MKPLTITSPTNMHALACYATLTCLGLVYSTREPPEALGKLLGEAIGDLWSVGLLMSACAAFVAAIIASKMKDPSNALSTELTTVFFVAFFGAIYTGSLIVGYGFDSIPATTIFAAGSTLGCIARLIQGGIERSKLRRMKMAAPATIEVAAEPDG